MEKYFFFILLPLVLSNVLHMYVVKRNAFPILAIPLAATVFGTNKTWRGFVLLPLLNGGAACLINYFLLLFGSLEAYCYGFVLGGVYLLFELPNSWLKRSLGIGAGQPSDKHPRFFMLLDKMDSALGVSLVSKFLFDLSWGEAGILFLFSVSLHVFFSWLLTLLRLKKRF